jgi:universal stress protein E
VPNIAAQLEAEAARHAAEALDKALKGRSLPAAQRHLLPRHAVDAIPACAKDLKAGLVVMGAVSRSGLKRLLIGNTAERILDALACDVLVVKPARFAAKVPRGRRGVQFIATPLVA